MNFDARGYWEDRLSVLDCSSVGYLGLGLSYNRWLYRVRRHVLRRLIRSRGLDLSDATVLDIGSGTGFYVAEWRDLGAKRVVATDLTDAAVAGLRARFADVECRRLDVAAELGDWPGQRFDVVSAFDVLFHVVDDDLYRAAIANLGRLVGDGGYLVVTENLVHGVRQSGRHHVSRTFDEVSTLLDRAGFDLVERRPAFVVMNSPVDARSAVRAKVWRVIETLAGKGEAVGFLLGALLYPLEIVLVSLVREGPSTEILLCRRRARAVGGAPGP